MKKSSPLSRLILWLMLVTTTLLPAQMTGSLPIDPVEYYAYPEWKAPDLPDLKSEKVLLTEMMPEAGNQGAQGSCTAWALGYAGMSYLEAVRRGREPEGPDRTFSPSYIYNQIAIIKDGKDSGSLIVDGLTLLKQQGVPPLSEFAYNDTTIYRDPSIEARKTAKGYRIQQFGRLTNTQGIKAALRLGYPVIIAIQTSPQFKQKSQSFDVYSEQHFERGQVEWKTMAQQKGVRPEEFMHHLHAMTVVGFDDAKQAFLVINSWGKDWGIQNPEHLKGYCWMSYDLFQRIGPTADRFCRQAWVMTHNRVMHPRSLKALNLQKDQVDAGVVFHSSSVKAPNEKWHWSIIPSLYAPRIKDVQSILWEVKQGRRSRTEIKKADGDEGLGLSGTSDRPGVIPVNAIVTFKDGSRVSLSHHILVMDEPDYLQDRFKLDIADYYYGIEDGAPTWVWAGRVVGDKTHYRDIQSVTWQWHSGRNQKQQTSTDADHGFDIAAKIEKPTLARATLTFKDGSKFSVLGLIELFSQQEDALRLQLSPSVSADGWMLTANLFGPLKTKDTITRAVYRLPDAYGGAVSVKDRDGWGHFNLYDHPLTDSRAKKPAPFLVSLELTFKDGTTRTLTGKAEPFDPDL